MSLPDLTDPVYGGTVLGLALIFFLGLIVYLIVSRKLNNWHTLSENERGIVYRYGRPYQDAGPGTYKLRVGRDFLVVVDIRPQAFDLDQAAVSTLDGRTALYSITAKARIQDVRKAVYCARNPHQAALARAVAMARRMINGYDSEDIRCQTQAVCDNITQEICDSMGELGMAVSDFRLNQLRIVEEAARATKNPGNAL